MVLLVKQIMLENVMYFNRKILFILLIIIFSSKSFASIKNDIIQNLENINNLSFNFEQNINGKIENGKCTLEYPRKIICSYDLSNKKVLISNGRSLVIKTLNSYYIYPIEKTPLNLILDKNFLIKKIEILKEKILDKKFINFEIVEKGNEINIFFDNITFDLVGWQTKDVYQNINITYLSSIKKNQQINKDLFELPKQN